MEKVIQRKHDSVQKANLFQKRLVWDCMYKEEFIKVMLLLSEPHELDRAKQIEKEIFKVFMEFDADKSGSIDAVELGQAMEKMGTPKSQQEIQDLIMQVDQEGTGEINFVAFAELFGIKAQQIDYAEAGRAEQLNQLSEARAAFKAFDLDKSDSIDVTELGAIMKTMGKNLTDRQLRKMMASVDEDGSGEIDFPEFCVLIGIKWEERFLMDVKEIDAHARKKEKSGKNRGSISQEESTGVVRATADDMAPEGAIVQQDSTGALAVSYSPNGQMVAICCRDDTVKIYELVKGTKARRMCSLRAHTHYVMHVAWSPDSDRVVSVGADKMLYLWHVKSGQSLQSTKAHSAYIRCVDWASNGTLFATGSSDKTVKLWSPITLEQKKLLLGHSNWVRWVKFTFDSKRLISGGDDSFMIIWSIPEGQILQRITGIRKTISAACFLNAPSYAIPPIVTGQLNGEASIWLPDSGLHGFMHFTLVGLDFLPAGPEGTTRYVLLEVGRNRHSLRTESREGQELDWSGDTDKMVSCSVWDMTEVMRVQVFETRVTDGEGVRLLGEMQTTHQELISSGSAEGIQKRFHLTTPDEEKLTNGREALTVLRLKTMFEKMDHNANLQIVIEEGKNMKNRVDPGPINSLCLVRTQRGQEFKTNVVMGSKTPQWGKECYFGIGPGTHEVSVHAYELNGRDRSTTELGSFQLRMDKLLSKVCSQQEPLSSWYVVRNEVDRKSRGSVRLKFTYSEAVRALPRAPRAPRAPAPSVTRALVLTN